MSANTFVRPVRRPERVLLSVTKEQKKILRKAAKKAGLSMAEILQPDIDRRIAALEETLGDAAKGSR